VQETTRKGPYILVQNLPSSVSELAWQRDLPLQIDEQRL